jgi:hypothetical protein
MRIMCQVCPTLNIGYLSEKLNVSFQEKCYNLTYLRQLCICNSDYLIMLDIYSLLKYYLLNLTKCIVM